LRGGDATEIRRPPRPLVRQVTERTLTYENDLMDCVIDHQVGIMRAVHLCCFCVCTRGSMVRGRVCWSVPS
jgi:hypothetical protein